MGEPSTLPQIGGPKEPDRPPSTWGKAWGAAKWIIGMAALLYVAYDFFDLRPHHATKTARAAPIAGIAVLSTTPISEVEDLRVIWMPSDLHGIGNRCLLYTNRDTGATGLACPNTPSITPRDEPRR